MEIYKNLDTPQNKKFQDLLNSETAKNKIEEGTIVQAEITKFQINFVGSLSMKIIMIGCRI